MKILGGYEYTELKTLKDIKEFSKDGNGYNRVKLLSEIKEELKTEAIKWIKSNRVLHMNAQDILLIFFNLEERDILEKGGDEK